MSKIILVVDIETTGYLEQGGKIVEIGIVKLNLDSGETTPIYNSLIKEPGFDKTHISGKFGWIFKNSDLNYDDILNAPNLDSQRFLIQYLFDRYHATAYNKDFDFGFLRNRGFKIKELPCPMILATPILKLNESQKWPKLEEAWVGFFGNTGYIEKHRAIDDAIHEAKIVHRLYQMGKFSVPYHCVSAKIDHYFRKENGQMVFVYNISGSSEGLFAYRKAQGANYRTNDKGGPVLFSEKVLSTNRNEVIPIIISENGNIIPDIFDFELKKMKHLDEYISSELKKLKRDYNFLEKKQNLSPIFKNGYWGFCENDKSIKIQCIYDSVGLFSFGLALVKLHGKYGFIDYTGQQIIPMIYDNATSFKEGLALVSINEWSGFINRNGEKAIDVRESNNTESFSEGLAIVSDYWGNLFGFIDRSGNIRIPIKFNYAESFSCGLAKVDIENRSSFIDYFGNEVIQLNYDNTESFSCGLALVSKNGKFGFIDHLGIEVVPLIFKQAFSFSEGFAVVEYGDNWGFIDNSGFLRIPLIFEYAESFSNGLALVSKNGKFGFIDYRGIEVVPFKFDSVGQFNYGLASASIDKCGSGYIDQYGTVVIPLKYEMVESFVNGIARVKLNGKWGLIDMSGVEITPLKYDSIVVIDGNNLNQVELNGKKGLVDNTGKEITPIKWDYISSFKENFASVELNNKWGFIDKSGKEITAIKYDTDSYFHQGTATIKLNTAVGKIDTFGNEYWND